MPLSTTSKACLTSQLLMKDYKKNAGNFPAFFFKLQQLSPTYSADYAGAVLQHISWPNLLLLPYISPENQQGEES